MADILPFRGRDTGKPKGQTLCRNGHHKWKVVNSDPFAVQRGELVTRYRCERCGKEKTRAH